MRIESDNFEKETYLKNYSRKSILQNNCDFEFGIGINSVLYINVRAVEDENAIIDNISLNNGTFLFEGSCEKQFDEVFIENVISFDRIAYPVKCQGNTFSFKIPYADMINTSIKKWELKTTYMLKLNMPWNFFNKHDKLLFSNRRNKILIEDDIYDNLEKLSETANELYQMNQRNNALNYKINALKDKRSKLKEKNSKLKDKNSKLKEKNSKLKERNSKLKDKNLKLKDKNSKLKEKNEQLKHKVDEYKSRKIVKLVDKLK